MSIDEKTIRRYLKVKALVLSPEAHEAASATARVRAMEEAYPGLVKATDEYVRREQVRAGVPETDTLSFLQKAMNIMSAVSGVVTEALQGVIEAKKVRVMRTTRGKETYLTLILPVEALVKVRNLNEFQKASFQEALLKRVEEELDSMLS